MNTNYLILGVSKGWDCLRVKEEGCCDGLLCIQLRVKEVMKERGACVFFKLKSPLL